MSHVPARVLAAVSIVYVAFSQFSSVFVEVCPGTAQSVHTRLCCAESVVPQQGEADPHLLPASATSPLCLALSHGPGHDHHGLHPAMEVDISANLLSFRLTLGIELFRTSANDMLTCIFHQSSAEQAQAGWIAFLITRHLIWCSL